jgi:hypothetical protein
VLAPSMAAVGPMSFIVLESVGTMRAMLLELDRGKGRGHGSPTFDKSQLTTPLVLPANGVYEIKSLVEAPLAQQMCPHPAAQA